MVGRALSLERRWSAGQAVCMKFELWVLTAAMGCAVIAGFCNSEEPEGFRWYEPNRRLTPEQTVADVLNRPICSRDGVGHADYTNLISDYASALGELMVLEQKRLHPVRVEQIKRLMQELDDFTTSYCEAEHLRVGGNNWVVPLGDCVNNQFLMRAIVADLPDRPQQRRFPLVALPRLASFGWRLEGLKYDNFERFNDNDDEESRAKWIAYYAERRVLMMTHWRKLAKTISSLPTPVANRIVNYLEWRVGMGLEACYQDYFKPGYHIW
jgi:hypothetical protein